MSTSTLPAVLTALQAALDGLSGLDGVSVFSGPAGDSQTLECVELGAEIPMTSEPAAMNGLRKEEYSIDGSVFSIKPGAGETVIQAARTRAFAMYAYIETYLNDTPTIGGTCTDSNLEQSKVKQSYLPDGRMCAIEFTINVTAFVNP